MGAAAVRSGRLRSCGSSYDAPRSAALRAASARRSRRARRCRGGETRAGSLRRARRPGATARAAPRPVPQPSRYGGAHRQERLALEVDATGEPVSGSNRAKPRRRRGLDDGLGDVVRPRVAVVAPVDQLNALDSLRPAGGRPLTIALMNDDVVVLPEGSPGRLHALDSSGVFSLQCQDRG